MLEPVILKSWVHEQGDPRECPEKTGGMLSRGKDTFFGEYSITVDLYDVSPQRP